jgi:hypothetical protein
MAVYLNDTVSFLVNSVDLSDHISGITLNQKFDELEVTAMGDTFHHFVKGLESGTCMVDFFNDLATGKTNATLQAAYGTTVTVVAKATTRPTHSRCWSITSRHLTARLAMYPPNPSHSPSTQQSFTRLHKKGSLWLT